MSVLAVYPVSVRILNSVFVSVGYPVSVGIKFSIRLGRISGIRRDQIHYSSWLDIRYPSGYQNQYSFWSDIRYPSGYQIQYSSWPDIRNPDGFLTKWPPIRLDIKQDIRYSTGYEIQHPAWPDIKSDLSLK